MGDGKDGSWAGSIMMTNQEPEAEILLPNRRTWRSVTSCLQEYEEEPTI